MYILTNTSSLALNNWAQNVYRIKYRSLEIGTYGIKKLGQILVNYVQIRGYICL